MSRGEEMIESILKKHGYVLDEDRPKLAANEHDSDSPYRDLNDHALKNLDAWVRDLGIYKCVRQKGRYASYVGVAQWRRSTTHGDDLDKRDRNLKICSSGIKDFGDNRGYTPINLVMAAKGYGVSEAVAWLDEKLSWSSGGPEIDIEAIKAKQAEGERENEKPQDGPQSESTEQKAEQPPPGDFESVPSWWGVGGWVSANPPPPIPWIVQGTIPLVGVGLCSGQTGAGKTFIGTHLSACTLLGKSFAGLHVDHPGGVLYFEVENSGIDARIRAACEALGGDAKQSPFLYCESLGPLLMRKRLDKAQAKLLRDKISWAKQAMMARFGVKLRLVFLDTLTSISGIEDHDDTGEGAAFMNFCAELAKEFEIFIVVNDHFGKNIEAGTRGTTAKEARADVVLAVIGKPDQPDEEPRVLRWRKMRNAVSGREIQFRLRMATLEIGGVEVSTRTIEFLLETENVTTAQSVKRQRPLSDEQKLALNLLADCVRRAPAIIPAGHEPPGIRGTLMSVWREAWDNYHAAVHGAGQGASARCRKTWSRLVPALSWRTQSTWKRGLYGRQARLGYNRDSGRDIQRAFYGAQCFVTGQPIEIIMFYSRLSELKLGCVRFNSNGGRLAAP
jgi:hypothetical protein